MGLYEILKASKLGAGAAPDMYTALFAQKISKGGSGGEAELSGVPPLTFRSNGTPLLDLLISGNEEHSGTPTPDNPVMPQGTGERTENLFDESTIEVGSLDLSTGEEVANNSRRRSGFIELSPSTTYYISRAIDENNKSNMWIIGYDSNKQVVTDGSGTYHTVIADLSLDVSSKSFTTTPTTKYIRWYVTANGSYSDIMINAGSTALPYEPYGVKIPILSGDTTTPVYLGEVETTRKVKKLVFTGNENIGEYDSAYNRFSIIIPDSLIIGVRLSPVICSHYQAITDGRTITNVPNNAIYSDSGSGRWFIKTTEYTTAADFKSYLAAQYAAGTPVTVWYALAEPETGIVNEPLMRIGDYADTLSKAQAGVAIPTNNGSTTVDVETTLKPSEIYIKYRT